MTRKLATIETVLALAPIPGADAIEVATVRGWKCVVKKGEFVPGSLCIYIEIDSMVPVENPLFSFLSPKANTTGYARIRTIKLRGQISQGLCLPVPACFECAPGTDVTETLGIKLYEPEVNKCAIGGDGAGSFPAFLRRTDAERVQNIVPLLEEWRRAGVKFTVTEKLDGTSFTCYVKDGKFGVCSRNLELKEDESNLYWHIAKKYNLASALSHAFGDVYIQGEICGPGIQKNKYKLKEPTLFVFNYIRIRTQRHAPYAFMCLWGAYHNVPIVPLIGEHLLPEHDVVDSLLSLAQRKSSIEPSVEAEGLVYKSADSVFKVINPNFLLKHNE